MAYIVKWQVADGSQYQTDYTMSKKKALELSDKVFSNITTREGWQPGQGAWIEKV